MATLTPDHREQALLRASVAGRLTVVGRVDAHTYLVSSRRAGHAPHVVSWRDGKTACSCERASLGYQRCPHQAWLNYYLRAQQAQAEGEQ
jgi:hypothetical protein